MSAASKDGRVVSLWLPHRLLAEVDSMMERLQPYDPEGTLNRSRLITLLIRGGLGYVGFSFEAPEGDDPEPELKEAIQRLDPRR